VGALILFFPAMSLGVGTVLLFCMVMAGQADRKLEEGMDDED